MNEKEKQEPEDFCFVKGFDRIESRPSAGIRIAKGSVYI